MTSPSQRSSEESAQRQLEDLQALGIDWDGEVIRQQDRYAAYAEALRQLPHYECFCSRKDILHRNGKKILKFI